MNMIAITSFILFVLPLYGSDIGEKSGIRKLSEPQKHSWKSLEEAQRKQEIKKKIFKRPRSGNLPAILVRRSSHSSGNEKNPIRYPELKGLNRSKMKMGDIFDCIIAQDIVGYVGAASPVRAKVLSGPFKNRVFIGNATLDPNTKNVLVEFSHMRDDENRNIHKVKATVHSVTGALGLKGTHHSNYWKYFVATILSKTAEGYADSFVERERNFFGGYQAVPNPQNAEKKAVAGAAASTANMLKDRMKAMPEYTTIRGPIRTKVFLMENPKLTN